MPLQSWAPCISLFSFVKERGWIGRKCPFDYLSAKQLECRFLWARNVNKYAASSKLVKSSPITISIMIIIMFIANKLCGIVHARQHVTQRMMCGIVRASYMFLRGWCVEKLPNVTSSKVTNRALLLSTNICVDIEKFEKYIYLIYVFCYVQHQKRIKHSFVDSLSPKYGNREIRSRISPQPFRKCPLFLIFCSLFHHIHI